MRLTPRRPRAAAVRRAAFLLLAVSSATLLAAPLGAQRRSDVELLTGGELVPAPLADPAAPRFAVFQTWSERASLPTLVATASFGGEVGVLRWTRADGRILELSATGGMSAAFDMGARSNDLMSEDYLVGFPVSMRAGRAAIRVTPLHVSSHLGDEFAEHADRPRTHVTWEALDLLLALDIPGGRLYAGGVARAAGEPGTLRPLGGTIGGELRRAACASCAGGRVAAAWVGALDARTGSVRGTPVGWSVRAGLELAEARGASDARRVLLLASGYAGPAPLGQFASEYVRSVGLGLVVVP